MAAPASEPRRMQVEHRRQGSGRVSTQRSLELQGARTGWQPNEDVPQDADGNDDPDAFFGLQGSAAKSSLRHTGDGVGVGKRPLPSISEVDESHQAAGKHAKAAGKRVPEDSSGTSGYMDGGDDDGANYDGVGQEIDYGDGTSEPAPKGAKASHRATGRGAGGGGRDDDDDALGQPATLPKSKGGRGGAKQGASGAGRKGSGKASKLSRADEDSRADDGDEEDGDADGDAFMSRKRSKPVKKRAARSSAYDREDDDGQGERTEHVFSTPGGTDMRRIRKSIGTGHQSGLGNQELTGREYEADGEGGGRYPARRRWQPLRHWAGERVVYKETEDGTAPEAVRAEKVGVLTPVAENAGKRRSRSKERTHSLHKDKTRARSASAGRSRERDERRGSSRGRSRSHSRARDYEESRRDKKRRRDDSPSSPGSSEDEGRDRRRGGGGSSGRRDRSRSRSRSADSDRDHKASKGGKSKHSGSRAGVEEERAPVVVKGLSAKEVESKIAAAVEEANRSWRAKFKAAVYEAGKATARQVTFDTAGLPAGFSVSNSPNLVIQSGGGQPMYQIAVIRHSKQLAYERLPSTGQKPAGFHKGALAAAAFDAPEFISGTVRLEPRSVKDLESTHNCTQVFVVTCAQPGSLQVDIGPHTYLLNPGDHFFVPQNCDYKLVNHSEDTPSEVAFVVIKPKASIDAASPGIAPR